MQTKIAPRPAKTASRPTVAKRRVLIVDDHPIIRHGVAQTLAMEADLVVGGEASSATEALEALRDSHVDLAVIDVSLTGINGIELIKQIRNEYPDLPILVLSMHDESLYALRALRAGAGGYIMKREASSHLLTAVRAVLAGEVYVSSTMKAAMNKEALPDIDRESASAIDGLTDRELEVLQLVGQGHSTREIAFQLNLSAKTIETHRLNMKDKLEIKTAPELIRYAVNWSRGQTG